MSAATFVSNTFYVNIVGPVPGASTARKITSFSALPTGWYYGEGGPPSHLTVQVALAYLSTFTALGFSETDAFPGAGGEIMVTAYSKLHCIELTVDVDKTFTVSHQFGRDNRFYEPGLSGAHACAELARIVSDIRQEECATSESFISNTTTTTGVVHSMTSPLDPLTAESPYSLNRVALRQAEIPVLTFANSMSGSLDTRPHFGSSTSLDWNQAA